MRLSGDSYFLQYDGQVAAKPYALIARALARNTKVAVAKLAWHGRERLVLLRVKDGALVAHVLKWGDEVRDPSELAPKDITVTDSEIDEAVLLVDSMTTDDISGYQDEYRQALEKVLEAKAEGRQPPAEHRGRGAGRPGRRPDGRPAGERPQGPGRARRGRLRCRGPRDADGQEKDGREDGEEGARQEDREEDHGGEEADPAAAGRLGPVRWIA